MKTAALAAGFALTVAYWTLLQPYDFGYRVCIVVAACLSYECFKYALSWIIPDEGGN